MTATMKYTVLCILLCGVVRCRQDPLCVCHTFCAAPQDFDGSTVEVEFQPHTTETFATIPIVNDGIAETRENFKLKLTSTRVLVGQQKEMTVAIADDDVVFVKVQWLFYTVEEWWQSFWVQIQAVRFVSPEYYQPASYDFHFTVRVQTVNIIARGAYREEVL